jgi:putative ABC transport system substrate-binding protein
VTRASLSLLALLLAASALAQTPTAPPAQVVLVRLSDGSLHKTAEAAFRGGFSGTVRTVSSGEQLAPVLQQARATGTRLIVALGADAAQQVALANPGVPVLVTLDPYAQPREGTTVLSPYADPAAQLRMLREALPQAKRVGLLYNPAQSKALAERYSEVAAQAGLTVSRAEVADARAVATLARALMGRVDVLWLLPDSTVVTSETFPFLLQRSFEVKVPLVGFSESLCRAGALLALEVSPTELGQHAAKAAQRLLAGASTAATAGEPNLGSLCLNARAASLLGLRLPEALRARATLLIQ